MYNNDVPPPVPAGEGSSLCGFERTVLRPSSQIGSVSHLPFIPTSGGGSPTRERRDFALELAQWCPEKL